MLPGVLTGVLRGVLLDRQRLRRAARWRRMPRRSAETALALLQKT